MKIIFTLAILFITVSTTFSQDRFRKDYTHFVSYTYKDGSWDDWKEGNNTFVFNINDNSDVMQYMGNGKKQTLRRVGEKEEGIANGGKHYQSFRVIDEEGSDVKLQLFDDPSVGLKLIYSGFFFQFAKQEE